MNMNINYALLISAALIAAACNGTSDSVQNGASEPVPAEKPESASRQSRVLVSKGIIQSVNEVKVYSRIEGQLLDVNLIEGTSVRNGQTLFRLDDWELKSRLAMSQTAYEQAQLQMTEILVGQGYKRDRLDEVPESIREYARVKSGVNTCEADLEYNKSRLEKAVIKAPVNGVLTGINALSYAFVKPGETLCSIVDPDHLIVVFNVLETELRMFSVGTEVEVRPMAYHEMVHTAKVRSIGTVVDESGMVRIEAVLSDSENLLPGMTAIVNL